MRNKHRGPEAALTHTVRTKVRFSEVDSMSIVWHGIYVRYFEDGREDFGRKYSGLAYLDIFRSGFKAPIVDIHVEYLKPVSVGDEICIETRYLNVPGAKICFEYVITRADDASMVARGTSMQVFLDQSGELCLNNPPFYEKWKQKWIK